jgi:hypothetical protein
MQKESLPEEACPYGDVHSEADWDQPKHSLGFLSAPEEEIDNSATISIQKIPTRGRRLRVNLVSLTGFTDSETKRHRSAATLTEIVVNSAEFKKRVLAKKFTTTKKTSQEIYDHLMTGEEVLQKGVDYEMDIEVEMYNKKNNVVGYTYPNVTKTWLNRYVTSKYDESGIAGNLVHEWLHKLGYGHASASDHNSVPYAVGYIVRDMVQEYKKGARWVDLYPEVIVTMPNTPDKPENLPDPVVIPMPPKETKKVCSRSWKTLWLVKTCWYE